ncbi:NinB/ Orf homologous recombination mediator [Pantoea phage PdC23]|uniref:DUF1367 family protein n=1 Tax=Pantoea phage PdC23 TaxID=2894356 RepID=A0AAE8YIT5_9CAUD|nr:NinB/ Orf homologous recombination mediator [Pantoea phage PdC23]UGC97778.1 protein of unknown function DUF1367 [Pantoea phage PdC23]
MKIEMIKNAGGALLPATDEEAEKLKRFKNGAMYTIEMKLTRNPKFHAKMFAFFNFCFEHWCAERAGYQFMDREAQFNTFRNHLTVLAGFYTQTYKIDGSVRVEARSLAYANMSPEDFEACYSAVVNAAIKHVFAGKTDEKIINRLWSFF